MEIGGPGSEAVTTAVLKGEVVDQSDHPIQGAKVSIEQFPDLPQVETATNGWFTIENIPKKYGDEVRVLALMEGYEPSPLKRDVTLGGPPPILQLTRKK